MRSKPTLIFMNIFVFIINIQKVKRFQEYVGISLCLPLIVYNFISFILHFDINKWYVIIFAAGRHHIVRLIILFN